MEERRESEEKMGQGKGIKGGWISRSGNVDRVLFWDGEWQEIFEG
jgi:hypothetical protein